MSHEIMEMAASQRRLGIIDGATHQKITARHLGPTTLPTAEPITGTEVRTVREKAHLSQAALARYLNMTTGCVSQLERGTTQAKGPVLALLNVIRRKGSEAFSQVPASPPRIAGASRTRNPLARPLDLHPDIRIALPPPPSSMQKDDSRPPSMPQQICRTLAVDEYWKMGNAAQPIYIRMIPLALTTPGAQ